MFHTHHRMQSFEEQSTNDQRGNEPVGNVRMIALTRPTIQAMFDIAGIAESVQSIELVAMPDYAVTTVALVNRAFVLRCATGEAESRFLREQAVLDELGSHGFVPRVIAIGRVPDREDTFFQIQSRIPGDTVYSLWLTASEQTRVQWITELATAIQLVHRHRLPAYRVGYYQSALDVPFSRWIDGHDAYQQVLFDAAFARSPEAWERDLLLRAQRFCDDYRTALEYESGPGLGHGDLHPLNVLGTSEGMTGIIDWEWSLPGGVEPESDLDALVRWALYPVDFGDDMIESPLNAGMFACVIPTLLDTFTGLTSIPRLATRMTIYQIEHELHHII
ncbi:MAG: aminoglycoside phosphotransferase family protein, partial [Thermomicrobiales bacterium]